MDRLNFVADAVMADQVVLRLLINALFKQHPELTAEFLIGLDHVLANSPIPSAEARRNLEKLRADVLANQPTPGAAH